MLSFDEYEATNIHPPSLQQWLQDGADYNAWSMPLLCHDLQQLKQGRAIRSPVDGGWLAPQPLIFLDAPFGRANAELSPYLDFVVYIDTPLDVAMARRIQRDYFRENQASPAERLQQIHDMTSGYLTWARGAYLAMDRQIKPQSDLVVDGCVPVAELARRILEAMKEIAP